MDDPADLSRLADIAVPPPVAWWPPASGWWIVAAAMLGILAILGAALVARWRRNAYRRASLAELAAIGTVADPASAAAVSTILKRTALTAYPRAEVASLTGASWLAFLDRTSGSQDFTKGPGAGLARAAVGVPPGDGDGDAVVAAARRWVKRHRVEG
ncbi:DUF4381 family protein [Azospirillum brasilense]|uniref:DUF4381 domain-containing protein n=1 Tax=Azospirillum argentinense TaxID=2970906 RepID=UPI00190EA0DC|nr:DUF4381 domain-containing protein [Azospirillum argentinense]MBK3801136.1 DUF4381 family protein [Azospirillum argentinense]